MQGSESSSQDGKKSLTAFNLVLIGFINSQNSCTVLLSTKIARSTTDIFSAIAIHIFYISLSSMCFSAFHANGGINPSRFPVIIKAWVTCQALLRFRWEPKNFPGSANCSGIWSVFTFPHRQTDSRNVGMSPRWTLYALKMQSLFSLMPYNAEWSKIPSTSNQE